MEFSPYFWIAIALVGGIGYLVYRRGNAEKSGMLPSPKKGNTAFGGFTDDISAKAAAGELEPFDGREAEVERVIHIVMRRSKNNPLLIGNPGVGKTAIVHGLAQRMHEGSVPAALKGKRVLSLDLSSLLAGSQYRGELEKRLRALLQDLEKDSRSIILFIDEVHMLQQANGAEGALNVSDILKPALSRGDLQIMGATTWDEYEKYIRPDQALDRRFQPVLVDEPNPKQAVRMLKAVRKAYEDFHGVTIPDETLEAAVQMSDKKIHGRYLPDKAIDLIDEASAKVAIESSRHAHGKHFGVVHAASANKKRKKSKEVTVKDIADVVDQWVIHSKAEAERDARKHE